MSRKTIELPSFAQVAAGSLATLQIPPGVTYDKIVLAYTGVTRVQMEDITLLLNGKPIQYYATGDRLDAMNDYYGRDDTAGFLTLYFKRPEYYERASMRLLGLGTADVRNVQLKIKINVAAVAPVITAHAEVSEATNLGVFTKVKEFQYSSAIIGQFEIDNIPTGPRIACMHYWNDGITDVEVELDSFRSIDASKTLLQKLQKEAGRVPAAAATQVDYLLENDPHQALKTFGIGDFRQRLTIDAAEAVPITVEYLDGWQGL